MTVQHLIEELQKLPPNALLQEVVAEYGGEHQIGVVRWEGNHVVLEIGERYA